MGRHQVGARSELRACAWLIEQGYEVFRNVCSHGPIDIVAIKDGVVLKIDVKTKQYGQRLPVLLQAQHDLGVVGLIVDVYGNCEIVTDYSTRGSKGPRRGSKIPPPILTVVDPG